MKVRVLVYRDDDSLTGGVATIFARAGCGAVQERGVFTVVLSGGSTPRSLYRRLAREPFARDAPWEKTHLFWGDERLVPPDHEESNYRMAVDELIKRLGLPPDAIHRMAGEADPNEAALQYETCLKSFFDGTVRPPRFDLVLLGIGNDGHTASLFPGMPVLHETQRWVAVSETPKPGMARLTMTVPVFNEARLVIFLVCGEDKAGILREVLDGPLDSMRLPAQLIRPVSGELLYCVDSEAGALLSGDGSYTLEEAFGP